MSHINHKNVRVHETHIKIDFELGNLNEMDKFLDVYHISFLVSESERYRKSEKNNLSNKKY